MVYASIKEAWGIDDFDRKPPDNPYVVKDPIKNKANFKAFQKSNFHMDEESDRMSRSAFRHSRNDLSEADIVPNKKNKRHMKEESVDSTQDTTGYDKNERHRYFLDKNDEYSDISSEDSSRSSKAISKKIKMKTHKKPKPIIKNIREDFENHSYGLHNRHTEHNDHCSSMLEHLQNCRICRQEVEEYSKNTFIKEFIIFAGSGIIMFLFLDLLRKIAQRSQ
jgi:hypothetical protein